MTTTTPTINQVRNAYNRAMRDAHRASNTWLDNRADMRAHARMLDACARVDRIRDLFPTAWPA